MLGDLLQELRKDKGLTQAQVGALVGVSASTCAYENGVSEPTIGTLKSLARLYHVNTDFLLGETRVSTSWAEMAKGFSTEGGSIPFEDVVRDIFSLSAHNRTVLFDLLALLSGKV